jgi:hypothetical protein
MGAPVDATPLGKYTDHCGSEREVVCRPAADGTRLVIDQLAGDRGDRRLVAHLAADEPPQNAHIVCSLFLADERSRNCRLITVGDLTNNPFAGGAIHPVAEPVAAAAAWDGDGLLDQRGLTYRLQLVGADLPIPELRWVRCSHDDRPQETVSLREVIGRLERYEPVRSVTVDAVVARGCNPDISTEILRSELAKMDSDRVVLNRGLREAVLLCIQRGSSMSEIAMRCGRCKRRVGEEVCGDSSWLTRRIGLRPEGGKNAPTPWIHSDTLALIARQGLGVSPCEVELG